MNNKLISAVQSDNFALFLLLFSLFLLIVACVTFQNMMLNTGCDGCISYSTGINLCVLFRCEMGGAFLGLLGVFVHPLITKRTKRKRKSKIVLTTSLSLVSILASLPLLRVPDFCSTKAYGFPFPFFYDYCPCGDDLFPIEAVFFIPTFLIHFFFWHLILSAVSLLNNKQYAQ